MREKTQGVVGKRDGDLMPDAYWDFIYMFRDLFMIPPAIMIGLMAGIRIGFEGGLTKTIDSYREFIKRD